MNVHNAYTTESKKMKTTPTQKIEALPVDTRILYTGDVCNQRGQGTIRTVVQTKWGTDYVIRLEDGRVINTPVTNVTTNHADKTFRFFAVL
jgi:hypothetical protein